MKAARPLLSLEEALTRLIEACRPYALTQTETVSTFDALGRVLAADLHSPLAVPPQDNTSMDGYALRAADVPAPGTVLPVSQRIPAGAVGAPLVPGTAARIFTGAQLPAGADAVVMQEQCTVLEGVPAPGAVRIETQPTGGQWVRRRGEDVAEGDVVLTRGQRLTPQALGLAASVGAACLPVLRRPRVALFSTGDELQMPGQVLRPGAIYNSNRYTLRALALAAGCEVVDLGIVPDTLEATRQALRLAAAQADLIVTSGGVSVGEEDHLKPAARAEGELHDWQVAMKPGKPLAFGLVRRPAAAASATTAATTATSTAASTAATTAATTATRTATSTAAGAPAGVALLLGLPGNPVSSFVTWLLVVRCVLRVLQGMDPALPAALPLRADFDWPRPDRRREFLRVRCNGTGGLDLFANQSSGVLTSAVWADGLLDNPPGRAIARGDTVAFVPLADLMTR